MPPLPGFTEALKTWAYIGCAGFGGPAGQIALMHRLLVDEKKWISDTRFIHALNYCMLLPGPEAQQLATYIGWLMHGMRGGLAAGILFVLPGALVMLSLSVLYVSFAGLPLVAALFHGVKAAVLAIVVEATLRIARRAFTGAAMVLIAALAFAALFLFATPFPAVIATAAIIGLTGSWLAPAMFRRGGTASGPIILAGAIDAAIERGELPHLRASLTRAATTAMAWLLIWLMPVGVLLIAFGPENVLGQLALFFSRMSLVTFGGAYAVLSHVAQEAVSTHGWLSAREMLDGLALAETTPGPLILVLQHVGFLAAFRQAGLDPMTGGILGALITLWVTFVPSFMWIFAGAPHAERLRENQALSAALAAITAAVVGVILNLAVWFAMHVLFARVNQIDAGLLHLFLPDPATLDPGALALAIAAMVAALRFKVPVLALIPLSAVAGLGVQALLA